MQRYYRYSKFLQEKYGEKTYKLPVHLPVTCPNRDGNISEGGCAFCGEIAAGFENLPSTVSVREQLLQNRSYIGDRYNAEKYIAYFQNFSNTYLPLARLCEYLEPALEIDDIVEISLSTRPDCINRKYLEGIRKLLDKKRPEVNLTLELGLQTVNYHTLNYINRGHTLAEFIDAVLTGKNYGCEIGVHLIPNLPGDDLEDVRENARILSALGIDTVKLHALYIREGTVLGELYKDGKLPMISLEDYIDMVINFLEYLDPKIAVQRLLGRAPEEKTLFVNWDHSWWKIQEMILQEMEERDTHQGKKFTYLQGKALHKFDQD